MESTGSAVWDGGLTDGHGTASFASGSIAPVAMSWRARAEESGGQTSPEELIAAAHASCFCMALSHELAEAGASNIHLEVSATVTFVPGTGITQSSLTLRGRADGVDEAGFRAAAEAARGGCPVSQALSAIEITLDASFG